MEVYHTNIVVQGLYVLGYDNCLVL